jgi:hypothetical protein
MEDELVVRNAGGGLFQAQPRKFEEPVTVSPKEGCVYLIVC